MAASILQILLRVTKDGQGAKEAAKEVKELKNNLNDLGLGSLASVTAIGALSGATMALVGYTKQAVDTTLAYAMEVKNLKAITGESAEETSRVLQVMDDFEVKTAELTAAQKKLSEQGLSLSIETLAKLSDQYRSLNSGAEKTQFLVDNFGKSGLKLASAMEAGGDAIREMSAATSDSLILSEQAVRDAEEYRLALDALSDAWQGYQMEVGQKIIPELTRILNDYTNNHEKWFKEQDDTLSGSVAMTREYAAEMRLMNNQVKAGAAMTEYWNERLADQGLYFDQATGKIEKYTEGVNMSEEALKALSDANREFYKGVQTFQGMEESYQEKIRANAEERKQIEQEKAEYIAQYGEQNILEIQEFDAALEANGQKAQEIADQHEQATRKVILGYMEQKMMADGLLDDKEIQWLLAKGQQWGVYSDTAIAAYQEAMGEAERYMDMLNRIPDQVSTEVIMNVVQRGYDMQQLAYGYASGTDGWETVPAGYPNDSYPIFLTSGEKFAVIPAGQEAESYGGAMAGGQGGGQMEVVIRLAGEAEKLFAPTVERIMKARR